MLKLLSKVSLFLVISCFAFSIESTAITIDNVPISTKEFNFLFNQFMENYKSYMSFRDDSLNQKEINEIKKTVLDELLEENIIKKYAKQNNIKVSTQEVKAKIEELKKGFPDAKSFWKLLKDQKTSFPALVASMEKELLKSKIMDLVTTIDLTLTTTDLMEHYKQNALGEPTLEYNITLIVTGNKKYLLSLLNSPQINWDKALVNKKLSMYNKKVTKKDLPENINNLIDNLSLGQFSPLLTFDANNLFSLKVNSMRVDLSAVPEQIKIAISNEKKKIAYNSWLKKTLLQSSITLNPKLFPPNDFNITKILSENNSAVEQVEPDTEYTNK